MYVTSAAGDTYFTNRLNSTVWTNASSADKDKALNMATIAIDRLNFIGVKKVATQENQFPRDDDTAVPQNIKDACCEIAIRLLDGWDYNLEIEDLVNTEHSLGTLRTTKTRNFALDHIRAGIPSIEAWNLLQPYLRDPHQILLSRLS